ncbi:MAG: FAD-dependent oxidoreductase [Caldilineaceae bacterium SB0675_bin_29]|uniref:FAD-dependent oxidoreductase n=1 Tax=Caldilineaceae bacterium SB0675_bin_29 TaxID=2605266 RepID=A0A6B1FV07_9CHLR|nr:FAD-dependent oxidoreductase [Caldilineaceae bacterium SB0675_bin_29]
MNKLSALIIGGGIGGLTSAIALGQRGFQTEVIEKDPEWSVYGVGIIQQANVVRAVAELGVIDDYIEAGYGYDFVEIYKPDGELAAKVPVTRLVEKYPGQMGIGRPALQKVLADRAKAEGAKIRLGVVVTELVDDEDGVPVKFSDGTGGRYDVVVGADGINSQIRDLLFPDARKPEFAGQAVWRYNLRRPKGLDNMRAFEGKMGVGLVPLSDDQVYMYLTTPEPDNPRYPREGLAKTMRDKLKEAPPGIAELVDQITDDDEVVYRPLTWHFLEGNWYKGRVMLVGDAAHGTTPHLGQGAGMAIEDSLVLAEELDRADSVADAFAVFQERRYERCKYIVDSSVAICMGQIGKGPLVNYPKATADMIAATSEPL